MKSWDITTLDLRPRSPEILSNTDDTRAVVLEIPAGEQLSDHQVHERAWVIVVDGEAEFVPATGDAIAGGPGLVVEFEPGERHAVRARQTTRLLLLLTPWPGQGHPGAMTLEAKKNARERAAERSAGQR
jgi:quercetin dioxygenase-like cupin family protein